MSRIPVAVVGATGLAGQQFLASLAGHPMFEVKKLVIYKFVNRIGGSCH